MAWEGGQGGPRGDPGLGYPPSGCGSFKSGLAGVWEVSGGARGEGGSGCPGLGSGTHPQRDTGHRGKALPWGPRPAAPAGERTAQTMDTPPELRAGTGPASWASRSCCGSSSPSTLTQPRVLNVTRAHPWAWLALLKPPPGRDVGHSGSQCTLRPPHPPAPKDTASPEGAGQQEQGSHLASAEQGGHRPEARL